MNLSLELWTKSYGSGMKIQLKPLSSSSSSHLLVLTFVSVKRGLSCCHLTQTHESVLANKANI